MSRSFLTGRFAGFMFAVIGAFVTLVLMGVLYFTIGNGPASKTVILLIVISIAYVVTCTCHGLDVLFSDEAETCELPLARKMATPAVWLFNKI